MPHSEIDSDNVEYWLSHWLPQLKHQDEEVRKASARALGNLGSRLAVQSLIEALSDVHTSVRVSAATALGRLGDLRAVEALVARLKDYDDVVCVSAMTALGNLGDCSVTPVLIEALNSRNAAIRAGAAQTLGKLADERALEPLLKMLEDSNETVRRNAGTALGHIGEPAVNPLLTRLSSSSPNVRAAAALALTVFGKPIPPLIRALSSDNEFIRASAARALGQPGNLAAVLPLLKRLRDPNSYVRDRIAEALENIGSPQRLPRLVLASETLPASEKVEMLAMMQRSYYINGVNLRYPIESVASYCRSFLSSQIDKEPTTKFYTTDIITELEDRAKEVDRLRAGAEAVLIELMNRSNRSTLLRASDGHTARESEELLRPTTGKPEEYPAAELMRPSDIIDPNVRGDE